MKFVYKDSFTRCFPVKEFSRDENKIQKNILIMVG